MEGDSVTLHTDLSEIQNDDTILWMFGPKDSVVSQITRKAGLTSFFVTDDVGFRGRLQVDQETGSLTIRNTRIRHSGKYKLAVSREKTTITIFNVTVFGVVGETDEVKSETVMEGESVTLQNNVLVERDDIIVWRFGDKGILIAKIDVETKEISLNNADERFRDRLQLNQNGSLIIKKTKTENAGFYELQIRGRESSQRFLLSVTGSGLPPGLIAGIVVAIFLVAAILAAVVIYYRRKISKLKKLLGVDGRFRSNLMLKENGDLTITDIRTIHSGLYKLEIHNNGTTKHKTIAVSVKVSDMPVRKGDSVVLKTSAEIQEGDLLLWMFGAEKSLVATNATWPNKTDENLRDNMHLLDTGCLSIRNITTKDAGHYKLQIINSKQTMCKRFNVTVIGE
ncbi:uncharacterized protein [Garra rufa]|uniref:uncharacterized protein n=1 Tax=Garra rufa TaxID=137080 RepID=UPI003CCE9A9E